MWDVRYIRAYDLMAAGLFYINVTGAGLIAWLDFMQGRSVAISRERERCFLPAAADDI